MPEDGTVPLLSHNYEKVNDANVPEEELHATANQGLGTRHKKKWIVCAVISIIVLPLLVGLAIPLVAESLMAKYLAEAEVTVYEMEVLDITGGVATIRLHALMVVDAPFTVEGEVQPTLVSLLVADPMDASGLGEVGVVQFPYMAVESLTLELDITSTMNITSERLFHAFLSEVIVNTQVTVYLDGMFTVSAFVPLCARLGLNVPRADTCSLDKKITATERVLQPVSIAGMGGMYIELLGMDYASSTTDELSFYFNVTVDNPSQFYAAIPLSVYATDLPIYYDGCIAGAEPVWIGMLLPDELFLGKGPSFNRALGTLIRTEESNDCIALMLSNHMLGVNVLLTVNGTLKVDIGLPYNDDYPAQANIVWDLPGLKEDLIAGAYVPLSGIEPGRALTINGEGKLFNALTFDFTVDGFSFDAYAYVLPPCQNKTIDFVDMVFDPPVYFPARQLVCMGLSLTVSYADALCLIDAQASKNLFLTALNGTLQASVEAFAIAIPFEYGPIQGEAGKCSVSSYSWPFELH